MWTKLVLCTETCAHIEVPAHIEVSQTSAYKRLMQIYMKAGKSFSSCMRMFCHRRWKTQIDRQLYIGEPERNNEDKM